MILTVLSFNILEAVTTANVIVYASRNNLILTKVLSFILLEAGTTASVILYASHINLPWIFYI